jgi:hypothetical protein
MQWDAHKDVDENHKRMAAQTDKPVAGLLTDLKRRGLLDTTLVLWGGEFGRSPEAQDGSGRDHHNLGFTMWLAGGVKGGQAVGATDEIGLRAVEEPYHVRDVHTTILHQLGLDQDKLTFPHLGRRERLTLIEGKSSGRSCESRHRRDHPSRQLSIPSRFSWFRSRDDSRLVEDTDARATPTRRPSTPTDSTRSGDRLSRQFGRRPPDNAPTGRVGPRSADVA